MTRINVVPVQKLSRQHLQGEYREITRVFGFVRKAQQRGKNKWNMNIPGQYRLGTGHVTFFYDKLGYILDRYHRLAEEMRVRGYSPNPVPDEELTKGIDKHWFGAYIPTDEAVKLNLVRIKERGG